MLVLSRRNRERVIITTPSGEQIAVMVLSHDSRGYRLAFEGAPGVVIDREEIHMRKQKDKEQQQ